MHGAKVWWLGAAFVAWSAGCASNDGAMMSASSSSLQTSFQQTRAGLDTAKGALARYRAGDRSGVDGVQEGVSSARTGMDDVRRGVSAAMLKCCQLSASTMDTVQNGMQTMTAGAAMMADADPSKNAAGIVSVESGMAQAEDGMRVMSGSLSCMVAGL